MKFIVTIEAEDFQQEFEFTEISDACAFSRLAKRSNPIVKVTLEFKEERTYCR